MLGVLDPGAARALAVPARRHPASREVRAGGGRARPAGRRQARQPRHLLRRRRRQRRLAAREARRPGAQPRRRRSSTTRPARCSAATTGRSASRSASARGCGSARPAPDGKPRFVLDIEPVSGTVTVGPARARSRSTGSPAIRPRWCGAVPDRRRSRAPSSCAPTATSTGASRGSTASGRAGHPEGVDRVDIELLDPAQGIAPGQARCLRRHAASSGSATIASADRSRVARRDGRVSVATGVGSWPGDDAEAYAEAVRVVLGEAARPALPPRAPRPRPDRRDDRAGAGHGQPTSAFDLQPAGWRLTDAPGIDHRRARSLLAQDLDVLEEQAQGYHGTFKIQVAGPWTLAATVEKPRGDKVLSDHGARRELAQALAEGLSRRTSPTYAAGCPARPARRPGRRAGAAGGAGRPGPDRVRLRPAPHRPPARGVGRARVGAGRGRGRSRGCTAAPPGVPWALLRGAGARGLSADLSRARRRRPRRARRGARGRGAGSRSAWCRRSSRRRRPDATGAHRARPALLDMLGLDPDDRRRPAGDHARPAAWPVRRPAWARRATDLCREVAHHLSATSG